MSAADDYRAARARWQAETLEPHLAESAERRPRFETPSGRPVAAVYGPDDLPDFDPVTDLGLPGEAPFTRGVQPNQYRGRLWTMRQYAGFGSAAETNARFRYLLARGQTGLSTAFDLPTQMGYDADHPLAAGEVGRVGVAISTRADMAQLLEGIDTGAVSCSMTINAPAAQLLLFYALAAEAAGVPAAKLRGTIQNDVLKEYIARGTYIYPPGPSLRLITDTFAWCAEHAPQWNSISISGYHIREAGATAAQELGFTFANAAEYLRAAQAAGLAFARFLPRLSFFFNVHNNLFEEVAKFRAARRLWVRLLKERFGVTEPELMKLRFHSQTAGSTLTAQQPLNNVVRVTIQALAAVLGGTQSLHTNSFDEALALPGETSARLALRTQQIVAAESGVADSVDPLAGSYLVERWTRDLEEEAWALIAEVESLGGAARAIEAGFQRRKIGEAAYRTQKAIEAGEQPLVGVNCYQESEEAAAGAGFRLDPELERRQLESLARFKAAREASAVAAGLEQLGEAASGSAPLLPPLKAALAAGATLGETCDVLRRVFGQYRPQG
jgi:methylmalonyl-CoA mutase N-terminal domain/subunit